MTESPYHRWLYPCTFMMHLPYQPCCRGALLLQLLDSYATRYAEMLDGRSEALPVSELAGGARIRHIYQDIFVKGLDELNPSRCCILHHQHVVKYSRAKKCSVVCCWSQHLEALRS